MYLRSTCHCCRTLRRYRNMHGGLLLLLIYTSLSPFWWCLPQQKSYLAARLCSWYVIIMYRPISLQFQKKGGNSFSYMELSISFSFTEEIRRVGIWRRMDSIDIDQKALDTHVQIVGNTPAAKWKVGLNIKLLILPIRMAFYFKNRFPGKILLGNA